MFFDNRKAGKSTPITLCPDYGRAGCHGVDYLQVCSSRAKLWKKRRLIQSFEDRRTKACFRNLGDLKESRRLRCDPCPGCGKFGCEDVWSYESQNVGISRLFF